MHLGGGGIFGGKGSSRCPKQPTKIPTPKSCASCSVARYSLTNRFLVDISKNTSPTGKISNSKSFFVKFYTRWLT